VYASTDGYQCVCMPPPQPRSSANLPCLICTAVLVVVVGVQLKGQLGPMSELRHCSHVLLVIGARITRNFNAAKMVRYETTVPKRAIDRLKDWLDWLDLLDLI